MGNQNINENGSSLITFVFIYQYLEHLVCKFTKLDTWYLDWAEDLGNFENMQIDKMMILCK